MYVCGFVCYGMQCKGHRTSLGSHFFSFHLFMVSRDQTLVVRLSLYIVNGLPTELFSSSCVGEELRLM